MQFVVNIERDLEVFDLSFPTGTDSGTTEEIKEKKNAMIKKLLRKLYNGGKPLEKVKGEHRKWEAFVKRFIADGTSLVNLGPPLDLQAGPMDVAPAPADRGTLQDGDSKRRKGNDGADAVVPFQQYVTIVRRHSKSPLTLTAQQLNIVFNHAVSLMFVRHGARFYLAGHRKVGTDSDYISSGSPESRRSAVRVYEGFDFTCVRTVMNDVDQWFLQIDPVCKVISQRTGLDEIYADILEAQRPGLKFTGPKRSEVEECTSNIKCEACKLARLGFNPESCEECRKGVRRCGECQECQQHDMTKYNPQQTRVQVLFQNRTVYTHYNDLSYRVSTVRFDLNPLDTFPWHQADGTNKDVTYLEYYQKQYGQNITDLDQPMLECRYKNRGKPVHIVPELCLITEVDASAKDKLPKMCAKFPQQRYQETQNFLQQLKSNPDAKEFLDLTGLTISADCQEVSSCEQLEVPHLVMAGQTNRKLANKQNCFRPGGWGSQTAHMNFNSSTPTMILLVVTHADTREREAKEWAADMRQALLKHNAPICVEEDLFLTVSRDQKHRDRMRDEMQQRFPSEIPVDPATGESRVLWYCFLAHGETEEYLAYRHYAISNPICHQAVNCTKIRRGKTGWFGAITRQIIEKCGHLVWWPFITMERMPTFAKTKILTIGIDMSHAPVESFRGRSISMAALVACVTDPITSKVTTFNHSFPVEQHRQVRVDLQLAKFARDAMDSAGGGPNYLPDYVFVYRDGLTKNHEADAQEYEIRPLAEELIARATGLDQPAPTLVFILTNKDSRTRYMQRVGSPNPSQIETVPQAGREIEVYSRGSNEWCRGKVLPVGPSQTDSGVAVVEYTTSDGKLKEKDVRWSNEGEVRFPANAAYHNPPPGFVCKLPSTGSTGEFFLVPNHETLSTAKPVRYIVLSNQKLLTAAEPEAAETRACEAKQAADAAVQPQLDAEEAMSAAERVALALREVADVLRAKREFVNDFQGQPSDDLLRKLVIELREEIHALPTLSALPRQLSDGMEQGLRFLDGLVTQPNFARLSANNDGIDRFLKLGQAEIKTSTNQQELAISEACAIKQQADDSVVTTAAKLRRALQDAAPLDEIIEFTHAQCYAFPNFAGPYVTMQLLSSVPKSLGVRTHNNYDSARL